VIHAEVFVSEDIAQPRDASPFHGGVARSNVGRNPFGCLSQDEEVEHDGVQNLL
jgi:hypothetical protein